MPSYLVEAYLADTPTALAEARARAQLAAESDDEVHHVRTTFLPADEVVLHIMDAPSHDAVRRAAGRVDLRCGFHFRKAVREGIDHGRRIGRHAAARFLRPCDSPRAVPAAAGPSRSPRARSDEQRVEVGGLEPQSSPVAKRGGQGPVAFEEPFRVDRSEVRYATFGV